MHKASEVPAKLKDLIYFLFLQLKARLLSLSRIWLMVIFSLRSTVSCPSSTPKLALSRRMRLAAQSNLTNKLFSFMSLSFNCSPQMYEKVFTFPNIHGGFGILVLVPRILTIFYLYLFHFIYK